MSAEECMSGEVLNVMEGEGDGYEIDEKAMNKAEEDERRTSSNKYKARGLTYVQGLSTPEERWSDGSLQERWMSAASTRSVARQMVALEDLLRRDFSIHSLLFAERVPNRKLLQVLCLFSLISLGILSSCHNYRISHLRPGL